MDLVCEKYKVKMVEADAVCAHLEEYCKFRTACIINLLTRERDRATRHGQAPGEDADVSGLRE